MIELAVSLGVVFSLLFIEAFGMAAGGIVIPGYVALQLGTPDRLLGLVIISLATFLSLKGLGKFMFLFGRRQMVIALLIGTLYSIFSHHFMVFENKDASLELSAVGWVVPGLIGHWSVKQGFVKTLSMLIITSIFVRLVVIAIYGGATLPDLY